MPKYKVISPLLHDGVEYDVEGNAEGRPFEVEFAQDLADRCGAVDPTPLLTPAEVAAAAKKAAEEAQAAADAAAAAKEAAKEKSGKKQLDSKSEPPKTETPKAQA
jgi:hypothetical protein